MKLYLDTANIEQIKEIAELGILDGVTTNPSLMAKEKGDYKKTLKQICDIVKGPVSGEVLSRDKDGMIKEARELSSISEHVVVKIPCTADGLKATRALGRENIPVNMTLIFSMNQGLLGIKAGARYISPFVGRLDDVGNPGVNVVEDLLQLIGIFKYNAEVIFASVRHPEHVRQAAIIGAHIATIPYSVFTSLIKHPMTDAGIEQFLKDWQKR